MLNQPIQTSLSRAAFLRSLGLSTAALTALYFSSCSKGASIVPDPTDGIDSPAVTKGNTDPGAGKIDFTIDMTLPDNAKLKTVGQFVSAGLIIVANAKGGNYVALLSVCTHAAGSLRYRITQNDFLCLDHGGLFNVDGSVKMSPPKQAVQSYKVSLSADGNTIHVTE